MKMKSGPWYTPLNGFSLMKGVIIFRSSVWLCLFVFSISSIFESNILAQQTTTENEEEIDIHDYKGPIRKFKKPVYKEDSPRIVFDHADRVYDLGTIPQQGTKDQIVIVTNTGKSDLTISDVKTGYGCTVDVTTPKTIPAGGQAEITFSFVTGMRTGFMEKKVRVLSNDPVMRTSILIFKARIEFIYTLDPVYVSFGTLTRGDLAEKRYVTITIAPKETFDVNGILCDNPHLAIIEQQTDDRNRRLLEVSLKETLPIGVFSDHVIIKTTNSKKPFASFKVSGNLCGDISVRPGTILFHLTKHNDSVIQSVTLEHRKNLRINVQKMMVSKPSDFKQTSDRMKQANSELTILEPVSSDIHWEKEDTPAEGPSRIKLMFKRTLNENDVVFGQVVFLTDDPVHKEVIVDFYGYRGSFNPIQQRMKKTETDEIPKDRGPTRPISKP